MPACKYVTHSLTCKGEAAIVVWSLPNVGEMHWIHTSHDVNKKKTDKLIHVHVCVAIKARPNECV